MTVAELVEQAIREGRHSTEVPLQVCAQCGEWKSIYHTTQDGKRVCRDCAGELPKLTFADLDRMRAPEDRGKTL